MDTSWTIAPLGSIARVRYLSIAENLLRRALNLGCGASRKACMANWYYFADCYVFEWSHFSCDFRFSIFAAHR
jgi:hypothetical protein